MADLLDDREGARATQLAEFNEELGRRLASLDRGESVSLSEIRSRLEQKSQERRQRETENRRSLDSD